VFAKLYVEADTFTLNLMWNCLYYTVTVRSCLLFWYCKELSLLYCCCKKLSLLCCYCKELSLLYWYCKELSLLCCYCKKLSLLCCYCKELSLIFWYCKELSSFQLPVICWRPKWKGRVSYRKRRWTWWKEKWTGCWCWAKIALFLYPTSYHDGWVFGRLHTWRYVARVCSHTRIYC